MDGPIELPADANPLTVQQLFQTLQSAVSSQQLQIRVGGQQLQTWEREKGYYSLLQDIFIDRSLPYDIRHLAIIQLKNGIDKYWRKTAASAVSQEEKQYIRSRLLDAGVDEADHQLGLQNALVISKIVRFEFPTDWPDVITSIVARLRSATVPGANPGHLPRLLLILLRIVKELSTARLQRSRASLQSVTPEIIYVLGRIYIEKVQRWRTFLTQGGDDEGGAMDDLEQSLLAVKVLRRLLIAGYEFPNRDKDVQEFWVVTRDQFGDFLGLVTRDDALAPHVTQLLGKILIQLAKLHVDMAKTHPAAFALLPDSVGLTRAYWGLVFQFGLDFGSKFAVLPSAVQSSGDVDDGKPLTERLSLQGLLLCRSCVKMACSPTKSFKYRHEQEREEQKQSIDLIKSDLLTDELVRQVMEALVTRFFVFRESDLRDWEEEPEEWEAREEGEGDAWEYSIRGVSEKLFLDLIIYYKDSLVQPLLAVFLSVSSPGTDNILFKDSIYTAVGLAASVLQRDLDFDAFLTSTLVAEVQTQQPGFNVLRRRIAILLGQWTPVKIAGANRSVVYQIFAHLLNADDPLNDEVVRITAGRQLKHVADEWEFAAAPFLPYAPDVLGRLMALIREIELTETKMALLNTVSVIVERMEHHITPFAEEIVALLPPLWEQSGETHLMKQAILALFTRLINSMQVESQRYHAMILPLINRVVESGSEMQGYLLDDALDLWAAVLTQTVAPASATLMLLAPHLFPIFELGSENLRKGLEITESYLLLAPSEMLQDTVRERLLGSFAALLQSVKPSAVGHITRMLEVLVRVAEGLGGDAATEVVGSGLVASGIMGHAVHALNLNWEARQTTGPRRLRPPLDGAVATDYLSVFARLALASPGVFTRSVRRASTSPDESVAHILDEWFYHFGNLGDPAQRKLSCLGMTRLLETGEHWILSRMQDLMTVWTDVVREVQDGMEDPKADNLVKWDVEGLKPAHPEPPETERRRLFTFADPVHRTNTLEWINHHLLQTMERSGGQDAFQREWLVNVDQDIIRSFGELGVL